MEIIVGIIIGALLSVFYYINVLDNKIKSIKECKCKGGK